MSTAAMFERATQPRANLREAARLPALSRHDRLSAVEVATLALAGAAAGAAVALVHIRAGIPGNAILRAVPAMALGLSLVPRRMAGSAMAASAGLTASLLVANGAGRMPPAALAGLLALGPALDVAMIGAPVGWRLYARFALAGAVANALAFVIRLSSSWLGIEFAGGRRFESFGAMAFVSFMACGAIAGLVSAVVWFRWRARDDRRSANPEGG